MNFTWLVWFVRTAHGWALLFLETIGPLKPQIWGKMCHPHQFITFKSDGTGFFFLGKNLKSVFGTPCPKKFVIFIFVVRHPVPPKMIMSPKNNFSLLFWKYCFIQKNNFMKNIQNVNTNKNGYTEFCHQTPFSPQNGQVLPQMGFLEFSPKILLLLNILCYNKTSVT